MQTWVWWHQTKQYLSSICRKNLTKQTYTHFFHNWKPIFGVVRVICRLLLPLQGICRPWFLWSTSHSADRKWCPTDETVFHNVIKLWIQVGFFPPQHDYPKTFIYKCRCPLYACTRFIKQYFTKKYEYEYLNITFHIIVLQFSLCWFAYADSI